MFHHRRALGAVRVPFAAGAPFTPASLANLLIWYKSDAGVRNAVGGALAANGQDVLQWDDQSGNAVHLDGVGATKPTFVTGTLNGLPVVQFSTLGTGQCYIQHGPEDIVLGGTVLSLCYVARQTSYTEGGSPIWGGLGSAGPFFTQFVQSGTLSPLYVYNSSGFTAFGTISLNTWYSFVGVNDGTNISTYQDNAFANSTAYTATFPATAQPLIGTLGGHEAIIQFAEIIVCKSAWSTTDRANIDAYLASKWGI